MRTLLIALLAAAALWVFSDEQGATEPTPAEVPLGAGQVFAALHGSGESLSLCGEGVSEHSSGVPSTATGAPSRRCSQLPVDEDPWACSKSPVVAGPVSLPTAPEALPTRVRRAILDEDGRYRVIDFVLDGQSAAADTAHVTYDLGALMPPRGFSLVPLRGHVVDEPDRQTPFGTAPLVQAGHWWHALVNLLFERVGKAAWPVDKTLLAFDEQAGLLHVRHGEHERALVEAALDDIDKRQGQVIPLIVEVSEGEGEPQALEVDVAWWREARATRGAATTFVADYDVEISQGLFLADPILLRLESGLGICATRIGLDPKGSLRVALGWSPEPPRLESRATGLASSLQQVLIEVPLTEVWQWRGALRAAAGEQQELHPEEDVSVRMRVGQERGPTQPWSRSWLRKGADPVERALAEPVQDGSRGLHLTLEGSRSGVLGSGHLALRGRPRQGSVRMRPVATPSFDARSQQAAYDDEVIHGAIQVRGVATGPLTRPDALDLTVEIGTPVGDPREVPVTVLLASGDGYASATLRLPTAHLAAATRRVYLAPRGEHRMEFFADLGRGQERIWLTVAR